jgi:hypothetical protein
VKRVFLSLCIGVSCFVAGIAPDAGAADTSRCASAGSTTVYRSSAGRIFKKRGHYYSCSYREGKKFRLAESGFTGEDRYGPFRVRSRFAAYGYRPSCGACESTGAYVLVQDLRTGRHRTFVGSTGGRAIEPPDGIHQLVTDLELEANGSVAWIVVQTDDRTSPAATRVQVRSRDGGGGHRLDESPAIERHSLRLDASTLHWHRRGEATDRHAQLKVS